MHWWLALLILLQASLAGASLADVRPHDGEADRLADSVTVHRLRLLAEQVDTLDLELVDVKRLHLLTTLARLLVGRSPPPPPLLLGDTSADDVELEEVAGILRSDLRELPAERISERQLRALETAASFLELDAADDDVQTEDASEDEMSEADGEEEVMNTNEDSDAPVHVAVNSDKKKKKKERDDGEMIDDIEKSSPLSKCSWKSPHKKCKHWNKDCGKIPWKIVCGRRLVDKNDIFWRTAPLKNITDMKWCDGFDPKTLKANATGNATRNTTVLTKNTSAAKPPPLPAAKALMRKDGSTAA